MKLKVLINLRFNHAPLGFPLPNPKSRTWGNMSKIASAQNSTPMGPTYEKSSLAYSEPDQHGAGPNAWQGPAFLIPNTSVLSKRLTDTIHDCVLWLMLGLWKLFNFVMNCVINLFY